MSINLLKQIHKLRINNILTASHSLKNGETVRRSGEQQQEYGRQLHNADQSEPEVAEATPTADGSRA